MLPDRLVAEADAEHGSRAAAQAATRSSEIPASSGVPGPGEIRTASRPARQRLGRAQRVVARDPHLGPDLASDNGPGSR